MASKEEHWSLSLFGPKILTKAKTVSEFLYGFCFFVNPVDYEPILIIILNPDRSSNSICTGRKKDCTYICIWPPKSIAASKSLTLTIRHTSNFHNNFIHRSRCIFLHLGEHKSFDFTASNSYLYLVLSSSSSSRTLNLIFFHLRTLHQGVPPVNHLHPFSLIFITRTRMISR